MSSGPGQHFAVREMMRRTIQCHHETGENAPVEYSDTGRRCLYQRILADRCFACRKQLATWTTDRWRSGSKEMLRVAAGNQENDGQME